MAWAQYTAGTGVSILEDTTTPMPHLESEYLVSMHGYLASAGSFLELKGNFVESKQQDGDAFLLMIVLQS